MTLKGAKSILRKIGLEIDKASVSSLSKAKSALLADLVDATPVDTGEARDGWRITNVGLENDVDHIVALNEGHSPQAEPNFIEHSVLKLGLKIKGSVVKIL